MHLVSFSADCLKLSLARLFLTTRFAVWCCDALKGRMSLFLPPPTATLWNHSRETPGSAAPPLPHAAFRGTAWGGAVMGWEQLPVLCIHLTPTTFQQLSLPIRIVVHVIIVILFSKTSPLSVSLPARGGGGGGGSHLALPNATARGTYPKHVRELISSTSLYNQTQSDEKKESAKLRRSESGEGRRRFPRATGNTWVRQIGEFK